MRHQGRISEWNDERGFGFITPLNESGRLFAHISEFPRELRRPEALDLVTFQTGQDEHGRPRAVSIQYLAPTASRSHTRLGGSASRPARAPAWFLIGALIVVLTLATLLIDPFTVAYLAGYVTMSVATYVAYGMDKAAAQRGAFRTEESALHLLSLLGGWPGALIAQQRFHHKTRKKSFRIIFWATVVLNLVMLVFVFLTNASFPG